MVGLARDGDSAHMTVQDEGIGIVADDLERIFERFQRGSNIESNNVAGAGLGLFICRWIVEQHGGRIWAESVVGAGTTMHVSLPLEDADSAETPPYPAADRDAGVLCGRHLPSVVFNEPHHARRRAHTRSRSPSAIGVVRRRETWPRSRAS